MCNDFCSNGIDSEVVKSSVAEHANFEDILRERKISPKFFRPKFLHGRPRGMSVPKCLFFQDLEGLAEVFGGMSAGMSARKLPLWAEFSFLNTVLKLLNMWASERSLGICGFVLVNKYIYI